MVTPTVRRISGLARVTPQRTIQLEPSREGIDRAEAQPHGEQPVLHAHQTVSEPWQQPNTHRPFAARDRATVAFLIIDADLQCRFPRAYRPRFFGLKGTGCPGEDWHQSQQESSQGTAVGCASSCSSQVPVLVISGS